jgi:hypothetical protein
MTKYTTLFWNKPFYTMLIMHGWTSSIKATGAVLQYNGVALPVD